MHSCYRRDERVRDEAIFTRRLDEILRRSQPRGASNGRTQCQPANTLSGPNIGSLIRKAVVPNFVAIVAKRREIGSAWLARISRPTSLLRFAGMAYLSAGRIDEAAGCAVAQNGAVSQACRRFSVTSGGSCDRPSKARDKS